MDSRAKKRFSDFAYKTCVFSPGAPKNQNYDKKFIGMFISLAFLPPNLTNMTKVIYLQALIDDRCLMS